MRRVRRGGNGIQFSGLRQEVEINGTSHESPSPPSVVPVAMVSFQTCACILFTRATLESRGRRPYPYRTVVGRPERLYLMERKKAGEGGLQALISFLRMA